MTILTLPHAFHDYLCPINGMCDIYEWKTGHRPPDPLLFYISSLGFSYIRQKNAPVSRMVFWSTGLGKRQHEFLKGLLNYQPHYSEGTTFPHALNKARQFLDAGVPVLLFGLDMFHLPYCPKFYQTVHVPGHIVLMVGYDEHREVVYVHDNSKVEMQAIPYQDLILAWGKDSPGQFKKHALCAIQCQTPSPSVATIIRTGLKKRAEYVLAPPMNGLGIPGMRRLAADFANWEVTLDEAAYIAALKHLVTFTGSVVPALPPRLAEFDSGIADNHQGARDTFARALAACLSEYGNPDWEHAIACFQKSGTLIGRLTDIITDYVRKQCRDLHEIPEMLEHIAACEEEAFRIFAR